MAFKTFLQNLGATHLFDFNNRGTQTSDDLGDSSTPTKITGGNYAFDTDPVCEGVTHSLDVVSTLNTATNGAIFQNKHDINEKISDFWASSAYSVICWFKQASIENPTTVYGQGGGNNNITINTGAITTFQAADQGEPFLIAQAKSLSIPNRPYFICGVWEHHTAHAGSYNRVILYINGVEQEIFENNGNANFPNYHSATIQCGNMLNTLKSFSETTLATQTTDKNVNFLGLYESQSITKAQAREIFERSTLAEVTISADTVANQQSALDALIGNTYKNKNCAVRIIQATDATDYRLFVDNINFDADPNLEDISVQFVGTGTLTLENTNGTEVKYHSAPTEVETNSTTHAGGGSIVVVDNTLRVTSNQTITNSTASKIVFDGAGTTYTVDGGSMTEFENVSGHTVTVLVLGTSVPTLTESSGSIVASAQFPWSVTNVEATATLQLFNVTKNLEVENINTGGTSGSKVDSTGTYNDTEVSVGDIIRLRITCQAGAEAFLPFETNGVATSVGIFFKAEQVADEVYNANAINADNLTTVSADYPNVQIDISDGDGVADVRELYAFYVKQTTSSTGIENWFGAIDAIDRMNYRVNTDRADIKIQNTGNTPLIISGARIFRDDEVSILHADTGDQPMTQDNGELVQFVKGQVSESLDNQLPSAVANAINGNATINGINKNAKLIPALL